MLAPRMPTREGDDLALARAVARGDLGAFEEIMRRHNRMLYRAARAILRDDAEAEDCLQAAYLLAYQSIDAFAGRAKLSTWLARIVVNEALGRKRRAARQGVMIALDAAAGGARAPGGAFAALAADTPGPETEALRGAHAALIERRIDALPEGFREVFVLRALEELSVGETAAVLDIEATTVRTRYCRARSMLRDSLAREPDLARDGAFAFAGARCDRSVAGVLARLAPAPRPRDAGRARKPDGGRPARQDRAATPPGCRRP
ncbi:MAG: RNA polymerase sigma factor [Burkholderiales bacterium]|nr:RNA polymerase sigma factor [Burkholderiales bacterium]